MAARTGFGRASPVLCTVTDSGTPNMLLSASNINDAINNSVADRKLGVFTPTERRQTSLAFNYYIQRHTLASGATHFI